MSNHIDSAHKDIDAVLDKLEELRAELSRARTVTALHDKLSAVEKAYKLVDNFTVNLARALTELRKA